MKSAKRWKIFVGVGLAYLAIACAPKRNETQFSKNKEAESGQIYSPDQMRAALGADRYDALVAGIGQDNLNLLTYGIGISNMAQLINGITGPGKLTALMSDGPNSKKLNVIEVLDLLNKLDDACQLPGSFGTDTIAKMTNMINMVSNAGMEGIKNIVHGVTDTTAAVPSFNDPNGANYNNAIARLSLMISLLNEALSVMPTLINDLAAPSGTFSAPGTVKLIRLVNGAKDLRDIAVIINGTSSITNITSVMQGLTGNMYCSKPQYLTQSTCTGNGGTWTNTICSNPAHANRTACEGAGATWTADGIENMGRMINELDRVCANGAGTHDLALTNGTACIAAGKNWHTKASKIPVIVNNITVVANMYNIVNGLSNDNKRPAWPSGLPAAYAGDGGNVFDGVDSMVATLNTINVAGMGDPATANMVPFGLNGVKRLAYMVNNLDTTPVYGNDTNFDETTGGFNCVTGNFDNRLNWAFSNNGSAGAPFSGKSWATDNLSAQAGSCSLRNDPTAATIFTQTQSVEIVANITTAGNLTYYDRTALNTGDVLRFYVDDAQMSTRTGTNAWTQRTQAVTTGVHRFRWDVQRALNSTGQVYLDTVVLPGDKGAARTAAEKTYIMMNNLYIASSLTNVADMLNNVTAPACIATPTSCSPTWNNGLDTLIHVVNRVEYPASIATVPRLATTVNSISNLNIMYDILNNMDTQASTNQLVALMDFVQTPANVPTLINNLTGAAGVRTADILKTLNAAGTTNMLRVVADTPAGAPILDTARLLNGVTNTIRVAEILNKLKLSANVYDTKSATVTISVASPAVVTWTGHGLIQNARVSFSTTGRLPTGLFSGRVYYACIVDANSFRLSTDLTCSSLQNSTAAGSGTHTGNAGDETWFNSPNPGGGAKLAQFFNAVNAKGTGSANVCNVNDNEDDFCIKNHLVRLVNDIATSAAGSTTVAEIVSNLRPNAGPGGNTGVTRMVDTLYDMKNQNGGTPYTDPLSNSVSEDFGRLTAFIKDMTGGNAGLNTARMVNEVNLAYMNSRVVYLLKNINRMRYLSRMLSEMTSVDLMLQLLNDSATNISTIDTLVDTHGNGTYGVGATGSYGGAMYGLSPSGFGCATADCDTNATDQLGRLIQMINNIYAIGNTLYLVNNVQDIGYVSYLINNMTRIVYLTDIVNNLTNVDLMVKVLNGSDACSVYVAGVNDTVATDTSGNCGTAGGTWFGVGRCVTSAPDLRTRQLRGATVTPGTCLGDGGIWEGADRVKLRDLLNGLGGSRMRGGVDNVKDIGDMMTLYDTMNKLGYNGAIARSGGQQVRVVRLVNAVQQCGLKPAYDKYIQYGPSCVNGSGTMQPLTFQFPEACAAANVVSPGNYLWRAKRSTSAAWEVVSDPIDTNPGLYYACNDQTYNPPSATLSSGGYFNTGDPKDGRYRLLNAMLQVNDGTAFSYIVGDVQNTQKTIDMMNGVRRIRAVTQLVNWLPGQVTAALVNDTQPPAVMRSLVYMANNLDDDENEIAKAFSSMIHFGTKILPQSPQGGAPACLEFTGLGPRRMAALLNLEAGTFLEGVLAGIGWQMAIPAMNCGWWADNSENTGSCPANAWSDGASGGMYKSVGASYSGTPAPTGNQCIRGREITAGYKYGQYTWTSGGTQGINATNCRSYMPWVSGGSVLGITEEDRTDTIIWQGMSTTVGSVDDGIGSDGCSGASCSDMWSILKGQGSGALGWIMTQNNSKVGFPPPRYNNGTNAGLSNGRPDGTAAGNACSNNSNNGDNWQCLRCGLANGDLNSNAGCSNGTSTSWGRYWGNYCSGATATGGSQAALAQSCFNNGGTWKSIKNYQNSAAVSGTLCKLDPSVDGRVGPP